MSKMRIIAGVAIFLAGVFSWLWLFSLYNRLYIAFKHDQYKMESFEVVDAVYPSTRQTSGHPWLSGTVAGRTERVKPSLPSKIHVKSKEELLTLFPPGSTIPVLYYSEAPEMIIQGETLRVFHHTPDFWDTEAGLRNKILCYVLLPVPLAFAFYRYAKKRG